MLEPMLFHAVRPELEAIKPMKGVVDKTYIKNLDGTHVKKADSKWALAEALIQNFGNFKELHDLAKLVIVWCGSTEKYIEAGDVL